MTTTRCMHEAQIVREEDGRESSFVTLTYDDAHVPTDYGLQMDHWQKFAKKLRKKLGPFRFLACGEYGEQTKRPHYHALLFGLDFAADRFEHSRNGRGERLYVSPTLTQTWGKGHTLIGALTRESAAYVARYALKKVNGPAAAAAYRRTQDGYEWQVRAEFVTRSLKPGLGARWLEKYRSDVYPSDDVVLNGAHVETPDYYDKLQAIADPAGLVRVKTERMRAAIQAAPGITPAMREAGAEIMKQKQGMRKN